MLFERLDWRPYGIRPSCRSRRRSRDGEPTRLDEFRGRLAAELRGRLLAADEDLELGEALDRWELSLFQPDPFRAEQLRESLTFLLGGGDGRWAAAVRAAVLLGETPAERGSVLARLKEQRAFAGSRAPRARRGRDARRPREAARAARRRARRRGAAAGGLFHTSGSELTHDLALPWNAWTKRVR